MRRLPSGGRIDRTRPLRFHFDGKAYTGFAGDTLASALLGAGVMVTGTSVSHGRPRGIMAAGMEEATGFAQVVRGPVSEPLVRLSSVPLADGMAVEGRHRATKGRLHDGGDTARFEKRHAHCDVLVIGSGPAGLAAARVASASGARVMLVEADDALGGALRRDGEPSMVEFLDEAAEALGSGAATVLVRSTAAIALDQGGMTIVQRLEPVPRGSAAGRLWHVRARTTVLATGMLERPIVFQDNDRPGIMLASAARAYLRRFALAPRRGVVFTTTDDGYATALAWHTAGVDVAAVVDPRAEGHGMLPAAARAAGIRCLSQAVVDGTDGDGQGTLAAVRVRTARGVERIAADVLAVSGGYEPAINLHLQRRGSTTYDPWWCAAVASDSLPAQWIAGGANACRDTETCIADGVRAAEAALGALGASVVVPSFPNFIPVAQDEPAQLWRVPAPDGDESRSFVDLHRDATVAGMQRAIDAGLTHVEHLKRYTLIGTGIEQGRSAKVNAGVLAAALMDRPVAEIGTSGSRPPVEPVPFHLLATRAHGPMFDPVRTTSIDARHLAMGAVFEPAGQWRRASWYPREGESKAQAVRRECRAVRTGVGLVDVSTLGKLDVQGPDATWFLEQLYANAIGTIPVGKGRYSVLCRMDGSVLDDGMVLRLEPNRYFVTTSTSHAAAVLDWMEEWLQTEWPDKRVWVTAVTEQFATVAIAGPKSRRVLEALTEIDVSRDAFPFLAVRKAPVAGLDAQIARVSFSGELAWEISVPWSDGPQLWDAAIAAGTPHGITPYGLEAMQALRIEKGYLIVGQDTEATTTPLEAGLGWMVARDKPFVGKRSLSRPAMQSGDRAELVGIAPWDPDAMIPEGAAVTRRVHAPPMPVDGHVTSFCWSETLGRSLGLALVRGGRRRLGETLFVPLDGGAVAVSIVEPAHYDPKGRARDGE